MRKKLLLVLIVAFLFMGCTNTYFENDNSEDFSVADKMEPKTEIEPVADWRKAYLKYLQTGTGYYNFSEIKNSTYTLIYLDNDAIPELFINTGTSAGGEIVATYYDGAVIEQHLSRCGSQYIEKSGLIYTDTGHMDSYPVSVTKLENGKFVVIASGIRYVSEEVQSKIQEDKNHSGKFIYELEGVKVTEDEFRSRISEIYDVRQGTYPQNYYTYEEFLYLIENGVWRSYNHQYECIIDDVTWEAAQEICNQKGGYLATVTCTDEAKKIASLIKERGLQDYSWYVGYRSTEWIGDMCYKSRWINSDGSYQEVMPTMYDFWEYKSPDYDWDNPEWRFEDREKICGLVKYNKKEDMIYIYAAPDQLTITNPEYIGKMGFICEYENDTQESTSYLTE